MFAATLHSEALVIEEAMSVDLIGLVNQLQSTLGKMEVALGAIADAIVWTGGDGTIQWCNTAFDRLTSRSHSSILGSKLSEVLPLMQAGSAIAAPDYPNVKVLQGDYAVTEYEFERDGRSVNLEISGSCADLGQDDSAEEIRDECIAVLVIRDVTEAKQIAVERKRTVAALRQSERVFRAFFENVAVGTSLAASDGSILQINPAWLRALGYSEAEFRQMKFTDYTHPDDVAVDVTLTEEVFAGVRDSFQLEKRYIRKDKSVFWGRLTVSPIRDADGKTLLTLALIEDINERKQAEAALHESEEQFRLFITASSDMVYKMSADWSELRHLEGKNFLASTERPSRIWLEQYVPQEDQPQVLSAVQEAIRNKSTFELEHQVIRLDGTIGWTFSRAVPLLNEQGEIVEWLGAASDVTARKQAEWSAEFLATVTQNLADATCVEDIIQTVGESLNRYLQVSNCAFVEIHENAEVASIHHSWHQKEVPSLVGAYHLADFVTDEFFQLAKAGRSIIVRDITTDPRIADPERFAPLNIGSFIHIPLIRDNEWKFSLGVYHQTPYNWRSDEIELMRELANRIWTKLERTRVEAALRESEERFRTLTTTIPQLIWTATPDGGVDYLSDQWTDYVGLPPEQFYEQSWQQITHPEDLPNSLQNWERSLQSGEPVETQHRFRDRTGEWRWQLVRGVPIKDATGTIKKWVGTCTDIQGEIDIKEALRESEEKYRSLFESIDEGFCIVQLIFDEEQKPIDWRYIEINPVFEKHTGMRNALGKTIREFVPEVEEFWLTTYSQVALTGEPTRFVNYFAPLGRWFDVYAFRIGQPHDRKVAVLFSNISDRKQAEAALQRSEARYRALVTATAQSIFITNAVGEVVEDIPLWRALTGTSAAEAQGFGWLETIHPEDRESTAEAWLEALNTGKLYEIEQRVRVASGEYRLFLARAVPVLDDQGNIQEWVGTQTDITDRRQAEIALIESETKFRRIVEYANDIIALIDLEGRISYVSPNVTAITGTDVSVLEGRLFMPFIHPDDQSRCLEAFQNVITTGEKQTGLEYRGLLPDGSWQWQSTNLSTVQDAQGNLQVISIASDISGRKQAEAALRQSEEKYRNLFQNSQIGIFRSRVDDGLIVEANQRYVEVLGYHSAAEVVGKKRTTELYVNVDDRQQILSELRQCGEINNLEFPFRHRDGSVRWGMFSLRLNTSENCVEGVLNDITDRKQAEEALRQSEARYQHMAATVPGILFDYVLHADGSDTFLYISPRCAEILEVEPETILQDSRVKWNLIHPDDVAALQVANQIANQNRQPSFYAEYRVVLPSGQVKWLQVNASPGQEQHVNGELIWSGMIFDISDRKHAEAALRNSAERLSLALAAAKLGDWSWNAATDIVTYSEPVAEMFGIPPGPHMTWTQMQTLLHPDDREQARLQVEQAIAERNDYDIEYRVMHPNGTERWVAAKGRAQYDLLGQVLGMLGVIQDITERKQAEAALQQREQEFRTLVENIPDFVVRFDRASRYLYINSSVGRELEMSTSAFLGKTPQEIGFSESVCTYWQGVLDQVFETAQEVEGEIEVPLMRGITLQEFRVVPELDNEGAVQSVLAIYRDITDRKRLEAELRQSRQFLDSVIENIPLGLFVKDVQNEFRFVLINQFAESFLGFTREQAIGLNDYDLLPAEQANYYREQDRLVVQQRSLVDIAEQPITIDGEERLERVLKLPIADRDGDITHLLCICEDITERKQREEALRLIVEGTAATTGDQFFRSFVEYLARVMQVQYAIVTEFADAARTRVRTLAFWQGNTIGENFEYDLAGTPCGRVFEGSFHRDVCYYPDQVQARFPDDRDLATLGAESYLGMLLMDSSGHILGHIAVLDSKLMPHDPGRESILKIFAARAGAELERKQTDEALQRRAEADNLLSQISRQFIDQDSETAIYFTLRAIAQAIGAERSCFFGLAYKPQAYGYLIHEWHVDGIEYIPDQIKAGYLDDFPMFKQLLDGNAFQISCAATLPTDAPERALLEPTGTQSVVVVPMIHLDKVVGYLTADVVHWAKTWSQEDINLMSRIGEVIAIGQARYKAEEALRISKDAAESASRAKSTFLANMSHELRTPLNAILGFAQLMQRDPALTPRQQSSLATINRSGEHLLTLINDVLEMSKIEAGRTTLNPSSFDLHRLLQTLQEMFQERAMTKQLLLQLEMSPDLPQYVFADEGKLRQVLVNLLSNAVKFTEAGRICLRSSYSTADHVSDNETVALRFEVEDTGQGIAPSEVEKLFQPFVQTASGARSSDGTGLGLAISNQFVRLMGGEIYLRSAVGQGSLFYFTVQAQRTNPVEVIAALNDRRVLTLAPNQPTYRILVVDDRPENLELITQLLNQVGFETQTATNGQAAILKWQTWFPHLIFMDMRMPVMNGYEAVRQIRAAEPAASHTIILALTASAFEEEQATILAAGCDDFLSKPFRADVLLEKLAEYLGVQYLYEPDDRGTPVPSNASSASGAIQPYLINASSLQVMPDDWVTALQEAALAVDGDRINQLIEQIPPVHSEIAQQLAALVRQFDFDQILAITQATA